MQLVEELDGCDDGTLMRSARPREERFATRLHQNETLSQTLPKTPPMRVMLRISPMPVCCEC